jgi:1-acyl-sn-glycerol-3-phosphate acyltransferase
MISRLFVWLCVRWFKWAGWKLAQPFPPLRKYVLVVVPHTSNVDFPVGIAARKLFGLNVKYVGKKELFRFPLRGLMLGLGGYPVDRSRKNSFVDSVVELFNSVPDFAICIAPEGTRKKVNEWKTGFYYMAHHAGVPIVPVGFDYATREVRVGPVVTTSGQMEADLVPIHAFFATIVAKHPEQGMYS